jgi:PPOX class probable F420-dependent enzyme
MTAGTVTISETYRDLLERPIIISLVTLMPDNQPQASAVWFSFDGTHVWINTARGRQKDRNMTARPQVTMLWIDPDDPYRYLEIRGVVDEITEDGALEHINQLARRYRGNNKDYYAKNPERRGKETRVIYKILPTRVIAH